ncbi:MAG: ferritin family protein [Sedimentisphaerales bacterium]|nr:ferritin family protein [Sedimentisphaerales bacterium]
MTRADHLRKILEYAIARESKAHAFYRNLALQADDPLKRTLFERFAGEEFGHKQRLEKQLQHIDPQQLPADLPEGFVGVDAPDADDAETLTQVQQVLQAAMRKEKASFGLYMDMAFKIKEPTAREMFLLLAKDEANHRALLEWECDRLRISS